ncbi:MAG: bifunctional metallophosphatase/5'-nucleotidase [Terracoccus sp.]
MSRSTRRIAGVAIAATCVASLAAPAFAASHDSAKGSTSSSSTEHGKKKDDDKKPEKDKKGKKDDKGGHDKDHHPQGPLMDLQILSFNDFHGNLEAPSGSSGRIQVGATTSETVNAGGVEYLATHLAEARQGHPNTLTVAAGDIVGASPLLSAAFHDEPTIESMNALGLDVTAVGNHEFDEGYKELQRLAKGGCIDDGDGANNQNSCPDGTFAGADFPYLAANVIEKSSGNTILPAYTIKKVNGAKIGFIGMTLKETPNIVTASGVAGLEFKDEVATANALVPVLKKKGVNAIVVLIHQGGIPPSATPYDFTCKGGGSLSADSPILPIARNLSPAIDMVVSGHTHQPYVCNIPDPAGKPRLLTSASSFGRLFTETNVKYDRRTQDIVRPTLADSSNMIVTRDVAKDAAQTSLIATYKALVTPIASRVIGQITANVVKTQNAAGESPLGDLIADAQLADPSVVTGGAAPVVAFMNPGGIRADLTSDQQAYPGETPGDVTFEEAFTVQPFNNYLVSMSLTGQQVYDVLNQQFSGANSALSPKVLQVAGLTYSHNGSAVVDGSVMIGGTAVDKAASYRIVTNNFLSDGGDGFPAFTGGTGKYFGGLDIDAFANYLDGVSPYTPTAPSRITLAP